MHQRWPLVLFPITITQARHTPMRLRQTVQRRRTHCSPRRTAGAVDRLCQRGGACQLHLRIRQVDHTHLCRAWHLVWRRLHLRRRQAHARCLRTWRNHHAECGQGRFQENSILARRVVRRHAALARTAHSTALRIGRRLEHIATQGALGQTAQPLGSKLRRAQFVRCQSHSNQFAIGARRARSVIGRFQAAREPRAQTNGARTCHQNRTRWPHCARQRSAYQNRGVGQLNASTLILTSFIYSGNCHEPV